jgi:hypothetical protein
MIAIEYDERMSCAETLLADITGAPACLPGNLVGASASPEDAKTGSTHRWASHVTPPALRCVRWPLQPSDGSPHRVRCAGSRKWIALANRSAEQLFQEFRGNATANVSMLLLRSPDALLRLYLMTAHLGKGQIVDGQSLAADLNADLPALLRSFTPFP